MRAEAVLSIRDGAQLWEASEQLAVIDVTVPSRSGRMRRPGIRFIELAGFGPTRSPYGRHPVTTVARTLLDLADVLAKRGIEEGITERSTSTAST